MGSHGLADDGFENMECTQRDKEGKVGGKKARWMVAMKKRVSEVY